MCPNCGARERHRLLALAIKDGFASFNGKDILHFAPEEIIRKQILADNPKSYVSADLFDPRADKVLNIERIDEADSSFDMVIASHVLEHVDDKKALSEIKRILKPGGEVIIMVPIVEGWPETYEDSTITDEAGRSLHFGRIDHVRFYGADFRDRVREFFDLEEYTADGPASAIHGLSRGTKVFKATSR